MPRKNCNLTYKQILDIFYRVGTYYITKDSTFDPNTEWGGTWTKLADGTIMMASATDYSSKTNSFSLSAANLPKHYHGRGEMEIKGSAILMGTQSLQSISGAFYQNGQSGETGNLGHINTTHGIGLGFQASKNWTGRSDEGYTAQSGGSALSNTAINLTASLKHPICYIWLRTA